MSVPKVKRIYVLINNNRPISLLQRIYKKMLVLLDVVEAAPIHS